MSKRVFKSELDAVANNSISKSTVNAKGDLLVGTDDNVVDRLARGTNEQRLVVDSATTSGLKYVADTTNYAVGAKGDLLAGTAADTVSALTVGANGETLVADSSATTGLRWTGANQRNPIINSGFDIWQRGTSFTGSNTYIYTADRWAWRDTSGGSNSLGQVTTSLPTGFSYALRFGRANGATTTSAQRFGTAIETIDSIPYADKTVTLSFYAKKGANFSPTGVSVYLVSGTGTNQAINGTTGGWDSYTGVAYPIDQTLSAGTLTTSWVRYSYTGTVASTATELAIYFASSGVGTAGADDYFYLTGLQLDIGSVALPYRRTGGNIAGELAACQRYYYKHPASGTVNTSVAAGGYYTASTYIVPIPFPVTMRVAPTFAVTTVTNGYSVLTGGGLDNINSLTQETANTQFAQCYNNTEAGSTIGYYGQLISGSTSTSLAWSAEL